MRVIFFFLILTTTIQCAQQPNVAAVNLLGSNDCDYTFPVTMDGQTFNMIVDTGSSNFAVAAVGCSTCTGITPLFNGTLTTTPIEVDYGSGAIAGKIADNVLFSISGSSTTLSATMDIMGITAQSTFFNCGNQTQGIVGMAYPPLSVDELPIAMDMLSSLDNVPNGFALQLCAGIAGADSASKTGNMYLGGWPSKFATGPMQYIAITQPEYYNVQIMGFTVSGSPVTLPDDINDPLSIVDSGTTQMIINTGANCLAIRNALENSDIITWSDYLSPTDIEHFWESLVSIEEGFYTINENFQMTIDFLGTHGETVSIAIPPMNWFEVAPNGVGVNYLTFTGLANCAYDNSLTIVGETLFTNYIVFFDRGIGQRIGFAPSKDCFNATQDSDIDNYASGFHDCTNLDNETLAELQQCQAEHGCSGSTNNKKKKRALVANELVETCNELRCNVFCYQQIGCLNSFKANCTSILSHLPGCTVNCNGSSKPNGPDLLFAAIISIILVMRIFGLSHIEELLSEGIYVIFGFN